MRSKAVIVLAGVAVLAGCGGSNTTYKNGTRPPEPINVTAAIHEDRIQLSPSSFGAGPIVVIVSNQSGKPQKVTLETTDVTGGPGLTQSTDEILPHGTGSLQMDIAPGSYAMRASDSTIARASVNVGRRRASSQDRLLQP